MIVLRLIMSALSMAAPPAQGPVWVVTEQGVTNAWAWSIGSGGEILVKTSKDEPQAVPVGISSPAMLDSTPAAARNPGAPADAAVLLLVNGEQIRGRIETSQSTGTLRWSSTALGSMDVPLSDIAAITLPQRAAPTAARRPGTVKPPCLLLTNGDVIGGAIKGIGPESVLVESDFGDAETSIGRVASIVISTAAPESDRRGADQWICTLADNQRWHVDRLQAGTTAGVIRVMRAGKAVDLAAEQVHRIVWPRWNTHELIHLGSPRVQTTPYMSAIRPPTIDDAALQRPRAIGLQSFVGGLTAWSRTRISYTMTEPSICLLMWVGLDPLRGKHGSCEVRVEAGGEVLARIEDLDARSGGRRLVMPVSGVSEISLVTDYGAGGELDDCVNWCDLLLVEKRHPSSAPAAR